jgi:hypothetical protein
MKTVLAIGVSRQQFVQLGESRTYTGKSTGAGYRAAMVALLVCIGHSRTCVFVDWVKVTLFDDVKNLSQIWAVAPALIKLALRDDRLSQNDKEPPWKRIAKGLG